MTSLEMIFFSIAFMFSPISISGVGGGWVHQLEPKCHFDLHPTFPFLVGGYISQNQNVTLTCIQLFHSWGWYIGIFFQFSNFFKSFHTNVVKITHNCKFGLKSCLDWVKMAKFGHFTGFSIFSLIFSPKMRLRLTWNGQFHPIHNFSHHFPPKRLISGEIPKIFISGGENISKFFE